MRRFFVTAAIFLGAGSAAQAQVELKNYADANGYIDVQKLTCAQLAGTFQEDADFLGRLVQRLVQRPCKKARAQCATHQSRD